MSTRPMPEPAVGDVRIRTLRRWLGEMHRRRLQAVVDLIEFWAVEMPSIQHWRLVHERLQATQTAAHEMSWLAETLGLIEEMEREAAEAAGR